MSAADTAGTAREGTGVMEDEVTRLRALYEGIALPWMAQPTIVDGDEIECSALVLCPYDDGDRDMVAEIDMGHGVERDDAHAALIVAAVNALPALCDAAERAERAERERDSLRAQLDTVAEAYRALLAGQPVPEYSGPVLSEQGRASLDRLRPRRSAPPLEMRAAEHAAAVARIAELEARVRELEAQGLALAEDARAAYAQRREMGSEAQRLREIIAGRTTPPTGAEIAALRSRVDALETALRDLAASRRDDQWCGDCGARWKAEHPDGCYVGAALRTLDAGVSRGE